MHTQEPPTVEVLDADEEPNDQLPAIREPANLFLTSSPETFIARASEAATALAQVIHERKLFTTIRGREHVHVEGWTLLGSLLGVFPITEWTRPLDDGWEARVVGPHPCRRARRSGRVDVLDEGGEVAQRRRVRGPLDGRHQGDVEGAQAAARFHHGAGRVRPDPGGGDPRHAPPRPDRRDAREDPARAAPRP